MDEQIANLLEQRATVFKELDDDEKQLAMDQEFLVNLTNTCSASEGEINQRMEHRMIAEPIGLGPTRPPEKYDAHDAQRRTDEHHITPSTAGKSHSFSTLSLLTTRGQLDAFIEIKMEIDKMITGLKQQQGYKTQHNDWCVDELIKNNLFIEMGYDLKELVVSIEATTAIVAETQVQMKRASENRESDNADFPQTVVDQRGTQPFLQEALARMKQVYDLVESHEASLRPPAIYDG